MLHGIALGDALGASAEKLSAREVAATHGRVTSLDVAWHRADEDTAAVACARDLSAHGTDGIEAAPPSRRRSGPTRPWATTCATGPQRPGSPRPPTNHGAACVRPRLVPLLNRGVTPDREEVAEARTVLAASRDGGAMRLGERMVDAPTPARARQTLPRAGKAEPARS